ncbi:regulatory protein GemA [Treponema sp. HNW]|uniref:regulatory protein GemA n=1 Tax=Treponema sp. HNW TaxID=3116654 RepID=UPI003D0B154A
MQQWIKLIHTAKNKTGQTDEEYRCLLVGAAGVESAKDIQSWSQYYAVMSAYRRLGFIPHRKISVAPQQERNPDWISARQEYYIRGLWHLASRIKDEASLRRMLKRITGVDDLRFTPKKQATKLILALRDITSKAGYNPDYRD